jgi:hypothetical protein
MDMKKEFVPYKQALELKQLGFNELCASYFAEKTLMSTIRAVRQDFFILQDFLAAPLYQQAFRFFREKYNLHSHIEYSKGFYEYWILLDVVGYDTYEEAELACLKKLIVTAKAWEIAKKK